MGFKLKTRTMFPALVQAVSPITLVKNGLSYVFGLDVDALTSAIAPSFTRVNPFNLYVATAANGGSDANDGLSPATAFLTIQAAVTAVYAKYDLSGSDVIINIGSGSFAGAQINGRPPSAGNGGRIVLLGAGSANTTITSTIVAAFGADIKIGSMKITVASGSNVLVQFHSTVTLYDGDINLGAAQTALVNCYDRSSFLGNSTFGITISGGAQYGFLISSSSNVTLSVGGAITVTGNPTFGTAFIDAINNSLWDPGFNSTLTGTANGPSYALGTNSVIDMENVTYQLPGTGYGTIATNSSFFQSTVNAAGNTVYGYNTGQAITTGVNNTAFGFGTLPDLITNAASTGATAVGANALGNATVVNEAFGYNAGLTITTSPNNVALGGFSIGGGTALTGSGNNTAVGYTAMRYMDGTANTNTALGASALSGSSGTHMTGNTNTAIGYNAGNGISSGSNNILVGASAALNAATDSSSIVIGNSKTGLGSNSINIGDIFKATGTSTPNTSSAFIPKALTLGTSQSVQGILTLANTSAGGNFPVNVVSSNSATASWTFTFPTAAPTASNSVMAVSTGGIASWTAPGQLPATATNDNASAGNLGEYIESNIAVGSAVALTTATAANVTSISLTAGDWEVDAVINFTGNSTTTVTSYGGGLSTTTGTLDNTSGRTVGFYTAGSTIFGGFALSVKPGVVIPPLRFSLNATTTIYLVAEASFGTSTASAYGILRARRAR